MGKDTKKNRYFTVGIGWDSWTLAQLEADAKLHQMDDQPAKLMVVRLTEYYQLVEKGIITPGITAKMQPQVSYPATTEAMQPTAPIVSINGRQNGNVPIAAIEESEATTTVGESEYADDNADAALDFFSMDED